MAQSIINIRMDESLKNNFDYICNELGLNMSTAITIFAKKMCREKRIPFDVSIDKKYENEVQIMKHKTKFRVSIYPENNNNSIQQYQNTFDNLDEAYNYLIEKDYEMQNIIYESDDEFIQKSLSFWCIELLNPENMNRRVITFDSEGIQYIFNDIFTNISTPDSASDPEFFGLAYGFIKPLEITGQL